MRQTKQNDKYNKTTHSISYKKICESERNTLIFHTSDKNTTYGENMKKTWYICPHLTKNYEYMFKLQ